jgi:hypothetical protein
LQRTGAPWKYAPRIGVALYLEKYSESRRALSKAAASCRR